MCAAKRLAITISGAVSLGSYEAGVLYEVIKAIGEHNEDPETLANSDERIEIDVITGASAGGMTAAIATQVLLGGADRMVDATNNPFYLPWVKDVDLSGLIESDTPLSILSSKFVEEIANRYLLDALTGPRHPAAAQSGEIRLGLAMSNLDGVTYEEITHGVGSNGTFAYTRFQDEFTWTLDASQSSKWPIVRAAALGCGAFPFAFRARAMSRAAQDYPGCSPSAFPKGPRNLTYLDGGIFQNEPLGLAKNLVDIIDKHTNVDSRYYLFVSPGQKEGAGADPTKVLADGMTLLKAAKSLARSIFWQARFQDWVRANKVNSQIGLLNKRAMELAEILLGNPSIANSMAAPLSILLNAFYEPGAGVSGVEPWEGDVQRLRKLFESTVRPGNPSGASYLSFLGPARTDVWLKSILLLEKAAGLEEKEEMEIFTITSDDDELGGEPLFAFAGFIDRQIREFDYNVGRNKARDWLEAHAGGVFKIRARLKEPRPQLTPDLSKWKISQFDESKRRQLKDRIADRLDDTLKEAGVGWLGRKGIELFLVNGKLNDLLGL